MRYSATITGVGAYVPETRRSNAEVAERLGLTEEWILTRTGIEERRIAPAEEGSSHLGARAARAALENADLEPEQIDLIIVATCTPDMIFPPVASLIQGTIGATRAATFDLNGVCAGFLQALVTGAQFVQTGAYRHVLVVGAEVYSRILDMDDRNTAILFGDGAGAVVLSRAEEGFGMVDFTLHADGTGGRLLYCPSADSPKATLEALEAQVDPFVRQDGRTIFKNAIAGMTTSMQTILERQGLTASDVAVVVPHQANQRIMNAVAEQVGLPQERVASVIREYGNTSAASIPLALERWVKTRGIQPGEYVAFCAYAGGLNWGAALMKWGGAVREQ